MPRMTVLSLLFLSLVRISLAEAVEVILSSAQVQTALERGKVEAARRTPPDRLYAWFGSQEDLQPKGFLVTKTAGLTVMSAHFALRGTAPGDSEIRQILDEPSMLVSVTLFGNRPDFARDCYLVLVQGERTIKPENVRFDGQAARSSAWPNPPAFRAKVVASFAYADFDPRARTKLSVFPASGGEMGFDLDLSLIE